jgi:hypothetical protein
MTKRIDKLCLVKERAVDAAEGALADARALTAAAEHVVTATEQAWAASLDRAGAATTIVDLMDTDARSRTLRQAVQRAEASLHAKRAEEERLRAAVAAARTELRRFEMWGERADATAIATSSRLGRNAEDALAARSRGTNE